jgi:hypothetical protein
MRARIALFVLGCVAAGCARGPAAGGTATPGAGAPAASTPAASTPPAGTPPESMPTGTEAPATGAQAEGALVALVDHHQHLVSPAGAEWLNSSRLSLDDLPADLARLLRQRAERWNDGKTLGDLYTEDSLVLDVFESQWHRGRPAVAGYLSRLFARPFRLTPLAYETKGSRGHIAATTRAATVLTRVTSGASTWRWRRAVTARGGSRSRRRRFPGRGWRSRSRPRSWWRTSTQPGSSVPWCCPMRTGSAPRASRWQTRMPG